MRDSEKRRQKNWRLRVAKITQRLHNISYNLQEPQIVHKHRTNLYLIGEQVKTLEQQALHDIKFTWPSLFMELKDLHVSKQQTC